jgi:RNA 2',3'-cyclic 3'-phosphodiesterase
MRLFVALDIDPGIRQRIGEFRDKMRPYAPDVRWVGPETFHITLYFIGETDKLAEVRSALQQVSGMTVPLAFRGTGFFPNAKSPRVFWVGIESDERLQQLADAVAQALQPLGFKKELVPFKPHLTLARSGSGRPRPVRGEQSTGGLRVVAIKLDGLEPEEFGTMTAREFCLYESRLSPSGAKYTKLNQYPLNNQRVEA